MSYYYRYGYYGDTSTSSTNWPPHQYYTRSELTVGEKVKKPKPQEEKTSFLFDPKGIGEEWPEKKCQ